MLKCHFCAFRKMCFRSPFEASDACKKFVLHIPIAAWVVLEILLALAAVAILFVVK